jgi:endonuclease YncB( thermonuclease family)
VAIRKKKIKTWDDGDSGRFSDGKRFRLKGVRAPEKHEWKKLGIS